MSFDDLKRLLTRQTLFRLDSILSPRLVPILYALGLMGLLLWAVSHVFASFSTGFSDGLWGLLELVVFGLLGLVALRIGCEALLVYFKANEAAMDQVGRARLVSTSLLEEVRDAIRDLAEDADEADDPYIDYTDADDFIEPTPVQREPVRPVRTTTIRRVSKRTPRPKS